MNRRDCNSPSGRPPRPHARAGLVSLLVVILSVLAPPASAHADEIFAHGGEDMYWIARVIEPPIDSDDPVRTIVRGRAVGPEGLWTDVAVLASRIISVANRQTQLAALLETGSWLLLWPGGSSVGAQPLDGARLVMLASDDDAIWAIGVGGKPPATTRPATAPTPDVKTTATQPATQPVSDVALYRLDRGLWTHVASLPSDVTAADLERASLMVVRGVAGVGVLRPAGTVETRVFAAGAWTKLPPIHAPDAHRIEMLDDGQQPIVWIAPEVGAGRIYIAQHAQHEPPAAPAPLLGDSHQPASPSTQPTARPQARRWSEPQILRTHENIPSRAPRHVAWAGQNLRLLFIRDGDAFEQIFALDGTPRSDAQPLRTSASVPTDSLPSRIVTLAAAAMLMMVVLSSLRRTSGGGAGAGAGAASPSAIAAEAGIAPAPLLYRFVAGVIDASPLLITCWIVFRDIDPTVQSIDEVVARTSLPFYTALGGYLLYTAVAEVIFARTVGKALFGLRVTSLDGSRPTIGAIVIRNALRLIDVTMAGIPLVLVLVSPLRQRVGDIAARTIVTAGRAAPHKRGPVDPRSDET